MRKNRVPNALKRTISHSLLFNYFFFVTQTLLPVDHVNVLTKRQRSDIMGGRGTY